jgi:glyoxylase-like metal-dependent hydrolase (beta-lactamase superfamily II)
MKKDKIKRRTNMSKNNIKLTFLGVGSAFAKRNYQTNLLIENGESLLIDCGCNAFRSLGEMKKNPAEIDNFFITHLHADLLEVLRRPHLCPILCLDPWPEKNIKKWVPIKRYPKIRLRNIINWHWDVIKTGNPILYLLLIF